MIKICIITPIILYHFIPPAYSEDKPLIFNPYTLEIYDIGDGLMTYKEGPYAAACPASDNYERNFNKKYSLNHNSLFVRHYSKEKDDLIHLIRCKNNVELAVAIYVEPVMKKKYLRFGFEVYFDELTYPKAMNRISSYFNFKKNSKSKLRRFINSILKSKKVPTMAQDGTPVPRKMGFIWVSKATLGYINNSEWRAGSISYSINKMLNRPATKCNDYNLQEKLDKSWDLDICYLPQNQKQIFNPVELSDHDCDPENVCVTKYTLVPAYQFQINDSKPASCTNVATVPVWSKTAAPLLDHVDKFLFAVSQVVKNLTISTDVYEILRLPIDPENSIFRYMYLHPNRRKKVLPIPRIIYKLAMYLSHDCDENITLCWFQVVIVIHNEPTVDRYTIKLCKEDKCKMLGWERVQYPNKAKHQEISKHIYCCEMDEYLKEKLGFSKKIIYQNLNLTKIPSYNEETKEFTYENKKNQIENEMDYLFGEGKSCERQKSWTRILSPENLEYNYL